MTTLTIPIDSEKKKVFKASAKKNGMTVTFLINQFIDAYQKGKFSMELVPKEDSDFMIIEKDKDLSELSDNLSKKLNSKFKDEDFESMEDQLKSI